MKGLQLIKAFQWILKFIIFVSLVIGCYFSYMKEAIEDYQRAATTVTTRSIDQEFEPPALTFCSNPITLKI